MNKIGDKIYVSGQETARCECCNRLFGYRIIVEDVVVKTFTCSVVLAETYGVINNESVFKSRAEALEAWDMEEGQKPPKLCDNCERYTRHMIDMSCEVCRFENQAADFEACMQCKSDGWSGFSEKVGK